jgi:hypothetical protein
MKSMAVADIIEMTERMMGQRIPYAPEPIETFRKGPCGHRSQTRGMCKSKYACDERGDGQRPGFRTYYNQIWLRDLFCGHCGTQQKSPLVSHEKLPRMRRKKGDYSNRKTPDILVLVCHQCERVLYAYQPVSPLFLKESTKKNAKKKNTKKKNTKKKS